MKIYPLSRGALLVSAALALAGTLHAQTNQHAPLGLLRLRTKVKANDAAPLASGKFTVDDLAPGGFAGAAKGRKNNVDYLALDGGKEWSRPLRGSPKDVTFVSFQVYASQTTVVDIAGARLGITAGPIGGSYQLMFDDPTGGTLQWKTLNYHVATQHYDGKAFAPLPTITVRIDPGTNTWDLFAGGRLVADNLPIIPANSANRVFDLKAGPEGAWLSGLVLSDENPIYDDTNNNGIDDRFESAQRGTLLPTTASLSERKTLADQWQASQRRTPPPSFFVQRLSPDKP